jgi:adenosyl cobinamide kinase/adenosyl cobinamide phosphate guanylyltransferase
LWLSNLIESQPAIDLSQVAAEIEEILLAVAKRPGPTVAVSGEIGLGLVPMEPLSRFYRDALGQVNQLVAAQAAQAYLVVAGLKMELKR